MSNTQNESSFFPSVAYLILGFVMLIPSLVSLFFFAFKKQKGAKEGYDYALIEYRGWP